jgi:trans-2,3-dihydro-3-hydroxyanthranilate isomerase
MQRRYVTIDVFTDRAFGGNPLAVVLDADGLSTAQMRALAREFNYSETTFVLPPADPSHAARVRIFTPLAEIPFAGHPNVGTALVLARRAARLPSRLVFEEAAGLVALEIAGEGGAPVSAELTAPQPLSRGADQPEDAVAAAVSLAPADISATGHPPTVASVGLPFLFAELVSHAALDRAAPAVALPSLLARAGAPGIMLYTYDDAETKSLHARMFAPGIGEDPATGSAAAALAALRAMLAPAPDLAVALRISQGVAMGRPSELLARVVKRGGLVVSAHVGGRGVEVMQGTFVLAGDGAD